MYPRILLHAICLLLVTHRQCDAAWSSSSDIFIGYRNDWLTTIIDGFEHQPRRLTSIADLRVRDISIFEFAVNGERVYNDTWVVAASAKIGTVCSGNYFEETITYYAPPIAADVTSGHSADGCLGIGYLIPLYLGINLQPMAGWSWNYLKVKINRTTKNGLPIPDLEGVTYTNYWQGPWIGLASRGTWCGINVKSGYEYHWPYWKGAWTVAGPDNPGGYSDRRRSHQATGQVLWIENSYIFPSCWEIGWGFKTGYWEATHGTAYPRAAFVAVGRPSAAFDLVRRVTWLTFQAKLFCGIQF